MLDLIIKSGSCYINKDLKNQDIGIKDGKILKIGKIEEEAKEIFGETFVELFCSIKDLEVNAYNKIITAWEREYLLLNV